MIAVGTTYLILSGLMETMTDLEEAFRRLHPFAVPDLQARLRKHEEKLQAGLQELTAQSSTMDSHVRKAIKNTILLILDSIRVFGTGDDLTETFMTVLRAMRKHCQAQETLFEIRHGIPEIDRYFIEQGAQPGSLQGENPHTGIIHSGMDENPYARGGYSLFIPESYRAGTACPLVMALHGGYGHGRDYLWTWLREARTRGFILLSPSSIGRTWSIGSISTDADRLLKHLESIRSRYTLDKDRILLTGMSDGGTFALGFGLRNDCPVRALAPVSCVLPPVDLAGAKDKRIYWVHGEQDWMFPLGRAVKACRELSAGGAEVRLKIVPDLSHAYPREENKAILAWFDPSLAFSGTDS